MPAWRSVDWSAHQRTLTVNERAVNVIDAGTGDPIVFVHGWQTAWQSWLDQLAAFKTTHRVIAIDLPGFGGSQLPIEPISIPGFARTVDAICEQLDTGPVTLVGNSLGGMIGCQLAVTNPTRIAQLVLVTSAGHIDRYAQIFPLWLARHPAGALAFKLVIGNGSTRDRTIRAALGHAGLTRIGRHAVFHRPARVHPDHMRLLSSLLHHPGAAPTGLAVAHHDLRPHIHQINCPTLVIWGANDRLVPLRCADKFERDIPGARILIYPSCGHVPQLEHPHRFNHDLATFLTTRRDQGLQLAS